MGGAGFLGSDSFLINYFYKEEQLQWEKLKATSHGIPNNCLGDPAVCEEQRGVFECMQLGLVSA